MDSLTDAKGLDVSPVPIHPGQELGEWSVAQYSVKSNTRTVRVLSGIRCNTVAETADQLDHRWSNCTLVAVPVNAMRENGDLLDRHRKHFVNAVVCMKLVRLVLQTVLRENGEGGASTGDADNFLQAVVVVKLARLFFYGLIWAPLTVRLGGLGSLHERLPLKGPGRGIGKIRSDSLRGKRGFCPREVTEDSSSFAHNIYFHVLRLPLALFLLCWFSTYAMVNVLFACLYYLDIDGWHVERKTDWPSWIEGLFTTHVTSWLTVLLYSSSILTNFSGAGADAHSPYTHLLGNAHAMLAQFVSLFWFSACFKRISKPVNTIRWSSVGVVSYDRSASAAAGIRFFDERKFRILTIRFDLLRPYSTGIIDAKFDLSCVKTDCLQTPLHIGMQLNLIRKEAASVTHGALLQHVIDEKSPLYMLDIESLRNQDVILSVTVRAVDKNSMKQVYSEHFYSAYDDDILWDRAFQDQTYTDSSGRPVYDFTLLDKLRRPM